MHKESYVPDIESLRPIQVGAALSERRFDDMLHDDEGDNISSKNRRYCELTAQYWAWKNDPDADYYGFWHYRRYLAMNTGLNADRNENINADTISGPLLGKLDINEAGIQRAVNSYDLIIPQDWVCDEGEGPMTVCQQWEKHFFKSDLEAMAEAVHKLYPEYDMALMKLLLSYSAPFCNLFIMNRGLFNEYCEFCFGVLKEVERNVDHESYDQEQYRTLGHLAERLLGVFVRYIEQTRPDIKILRVPTVLFKDTRPKAFVHPAQDIKGRRQVSLVLACDNGFIPYTSVLIGSVCENASSEFFYDIVLMHRGVSEKNQALLRYQTAGFENVSLRFADVSRNFEEYQNIHVDRHLSLETYYRFMICDIMPGYDKVLYLDCDMTADKDISGLYFTDIGDCFVGAVRDFDFAASYNEPERRLFYDEKIMKYLKLEKSADYFQAGCILFNLKKIRGSYTSADLFRAALMRDWYYHDQDVLNYIFAGRVFYLDPKWNVLSLLEAGSHREQLMKNYLPAVYLSEYNASYKDAGIIHYAGVPKPWNIIDCDRAEIFWKYARNTPYYEKLLQTLNSGYLLPFGSIVFISDDSPALKCSPVFDINISGDLWSEDYIVIDFIFMSDHFKKETVRSSLFICVSVLPSDKNMPEIKVNRFEFSNAENLYLLSDNIGFRIINSKTVRIFARQAGKFEGISWRVRELQSRDARKPEITVLNDGFVRADISADDIIFMQREEEE